MANAPSVASYTNDPANVPLDRVRLEVGDTDCANAYLTDAEIELFIDEEDPDADGTVGKLLRAASTCANVIAAKLARRVDFSHGPVRKNLSALFEHYRDLSDDLGRRASGEGVLPVVLGLTLAEKEAADLNESQVQPEFKKGMHDNPRSGPTNLSNPSEVTSY